MVSPLHSPRNHSISQSRPSWLPPRHRLEELLNSADKYGITLSFSDIGRNKNGSELIDRLIHIIQQEDEQYGSNHMFNSREHASSPPLTPARLDERDAKRRRSNINTPDMVTARLFLAIEVQEIIRDWAVRGLQETEESSALRSSEPEPGLDYWSTVGVASRRSDSISSVRGRSFSDRPPTLPLPTKAWIMSPTSIPSSMTYSPLPTTTTTHIPTPLSTPCDVRPGNKRKFESEDNLRRLSDAAALVEPQRMHVHGVREGSEEEVGGPMGTQQLGKSHKCPYFVRDKTGRTHPKCAERTFPNPRKLKEHVWQTTRPYRCNICLFGFGRDKTRAIHVKERKKGCKPPPPGSALLREAYEHSPEAMRDRRIDAARSTEEIVQILDDYDREKGPNASPPREAEYSEDEEGSEVDSQSETLKNYRRNSEWTPQAQHIHQQQHQQHSQLQQLHRRHLSESSVPTFSRLEGAPRPVLPLPSAQTFGGSTNPQSLPLPTPLPLSHSDLGPHSSMISPHSSARRSQDPGVKLPPIMNLEHHRNPQWVRLHTTIVTN
ncbi:hypothetical protein BJ508DRAFT_323226 [Ascobolus immersus RN42]|uniref:Uncharacterized protein n=1 Tax=Ascobolus immersus RN42 TaxID=1160509 RepID=A0A3N4IKK0_ASCIM|nr:hypothetical protein BJ508DRAFT_323226 [Ascobolus immersus RN42]